MGNCLKSDNVISGVRQDSADDDDPADPTSIESDLVPKNEKRNKEISKYMKYDEQKESEIMKLLLLGSGSSGKSTLFRQIECIHGDDDKAETLTEDTDRFFINMDSLRDTIRLNCIQGLIKLLQQTDTLSKPPYNITECHIHFEEERIDSAIRVLISFGKQRQGFVDTERLRDLGESMQFLWSLNGVKAVFKHRHLFSLIENVDYFLDRVVSIMDETDNNRYLPSISDVLNARARTTGIVERVYFIKNRQFNIFDVGGQRSERRKWIQLFDRVHGLIFVAALNHYCCVLFEDETANAMLESLSLFDEICNAKWFSTTYTQFILFLNKNDLFIDRLKHDKIPLSLCFGDEYKGPNYSDKNENEEWWKHCYQESIQFIEQKYLSLNKNPRINRIFTHITTATDKSNVQRVFEDVRAGIISQTLEDSGFS